MTQGDGDGPPTGELVRLVAGLAGRPLAVGRRGAALAADLLRAGLDRPAGPADAGLPDDPVARRLARAHRAGLAAAAGLLADAGLDRSDRERLEAVLAALDGLVGTVLPGARSAAPAVPAPAPAPSPARRTPVVGEDVAATAGAVVHRTPAFELIQYLPRTEAVRAVPVLVVGPLTHRHYLLDLAPGRSVVEHLVAAGLQVFALSWWNPRAEDAGRGLDHHARAVLEAVDACTRITRAPATSLLAAGSGGTVAAALLGHLAATGSDERVASLTLALPALDGVEPALTPSGTAPRELLAWAADRTRVPAALRADLADIAARDALAQAGAVRVLGTPVDLGKVDTDAYLVAGEAGPWPAAYRGARLLAGEVRFALAAGGPVDAVVAPPGGRDLSYRAGPATAADPDSWYPSAGRTAGSWWTDHLAWLAARSGRLVDAPPELGGRGLHAIAPTPGEYVLSR
jgi:poly[(R)-3-hydroxyalkanoate] polymerase subunit PhaC